MSFRLLLVSFDTQDPYRLLLPRVPFNAPSGRRLHRVLNRSRSSARDTSDLTSTRDELADCGGLEPMLAVATDQVVHGVGNLRQSCTPPSGFKKTVRPSPLLLDFRLHRTRSATGTRCLTKSPKPATTTMLMARCRISRDTL